MNYKKTIRDFEKEKGKKRRLKDLKKYFSKETYDKELKEKGNRVIYETFTKEFSPINLTLTNVFPGTISGEFDFTKGHVHGREVPEFYVLLDGKGKLYLQKGKKINVINLKKGEFAYIPENWAHRLINTGRVVMKVLTIYQMK